MPVKQESTTKLKADNKRLTERVTKIQRALGAVRLEVGKIVVGRDQVDGLRERIKRIDEIIDNA